MENSSESCSLNRPNDSIGSEQINRLAGEILLQDARLEIASKALTTKPAPRGAAMPGLLKDRLAPPLEELLGDFVIEGIPLNRSDRNGTKIDQSEKSVGLKPERLPLPIASPLQEQQLCLPDVESAPAELLPPPSTEALVNIRLEGFKRPEAKELSKIAEKRMDNVRELTDWVKSNFDLLDKDKDGLVSQAEVAAAIIDPKIANGKNGPILAALYNTLESMAGVLSGKNGVTRESLAALEKIANDKEFFSKSDRPLAMVKLNDVFGFFQEAGGYHDCLEPKEVEVALKRADISAEQRQALQDIREYQKFLVNKNYPDAKSRNGKIEIEEPDPDYGTRITPKERMGDLTRQHIKDLATDLEQLAESISAELDLAKDRVRDAREKPNQISQGRDGSCFFLASLISARNYDSAIMERMIKDNGNGTHTVTFPGLAKEPITVKNPTDAELANWAGGKRVAIIEKAFSHYYAKSIAPTLDHFTEGQRRALKSPIPSERIQGGTAAHAFKVLLGKETDSFSVDMNKDEKIIEFLKNAESKTTPLVVSTAGVHLSARTGLLGKHIYAVRYDESSGMILFENPMKPSGIRNQEALPYEPFTPDGKAKDGKDDGVFKMSLKMFKQYFPEIYYPK